MTKTGTCNPGPFSDKSLAAIKVIKKHPFSLASPSQCYAEALRRTKCYGVGTPP
ncbi:MAG: hypothetical protein KAR17_15025 [Cyclobacteriaceae bacterium]|nr:hypothetical protein [Cyclobacteriaceae bacterium]